MTLLPILDDLIGQPADSVSLASVTQPSRSIALEGKHHVLEAALAYLAPYWEKTSNGDVRVRVVEGDARLELQLSKLIQPHHVIAKTDLTLAQVEVASWGYGWARFRGNNLYDLIIGRKDQLVLITGQSGPPPYLAAVRAIRNLTVSEWLGAGALHLHAAALKIQKRGVLLLGDRRAGKTTQVCHILDRGIASFVSNDRVCLFPDGNLAGLPVSVNLRLDTQRQFQAIHSGECPASNPHNVSSDRPAEDMSLSPAEFVTRLGVSIHPGFVLTDVFHLHRDERAVGVKLAAVGYEQIKSLLLKNSLENIDSTQPFWTASDVGPHELLNLGDIRCWSINSGPNTVRLTTDTIISQLRE